MACLAVPSRFHTKQSANRQRAAKTQCRDDGDSFYRVPRRIGYEKTLPAPPTIGIAELRDPLRAVLVLRPRKHQRHKGRLHDLLKQIALRMSIHQSRPFYPEASGRSHAAQRWRSSDPLQGVLAVIGHPDRTANDVVACQNRSPEEINVAIGEQLFVPLDSLEHLSRPEHYRTACRALSGDVKKLQQFCRASLFFTAAHDRAQSDAGGILAEVAPSPGYDDLPTFERVRFPQQRFQMLGMEQVVIIQKEDIVAARLAHASISRRARTAGGVVPDDLDRRIPLTQQCSRSILRRFIDHDDFY